MHSTPFASVRAHVELGEGGQDHEDDRSNSGTLDSCRTWVEIMPCDNWSGKGKDINAESWKCGVGGGEWERARCGRDTARRGLRKDVGGVSGDTAGVVDAGEDIGDWLDALRVPNSSLSSQASEWE